MFDYAANKLFQGEFVTEICNACTVCRIKPARSKSTHNSMTYVELQVLLPLIHTHKVCRLSRGSVMGQKPSHRDEKNPNLD